ncbi:ABC transporter permease [Thalassomonas sp. M1454]|uniref:ABC transporter permease n=1 Tax=Thalassomonas sp. M1454 TaxID=2594477 RepID=UPI00117F442E|nr:ABC transporter permease [Thalassomonas sp. M1454]TRX56981.1 ABC transporter permease [Thalassomonas sp. M1454]
MWLVYIKELIELLRDRKTLFFIIALPMVIFPVVFGLIGFLGSSAAMKEQDKVIRYVIVNGSVAPEFASKLFYHSDFKEVTLELNNEEAITQAIQEDKIDLVIELNKDFKVQFGNSEVSNWKIYFNGSNLFGGTKNKVEEVLQSYVDDLQKQTYVASGFDEAQFEVFKKPIEVEEVDTADDRESFGEQLGGFIPYILIPLCLTGAMYPAIDLGAGEKERGTIETLLLTPVSRLALVLGKFMCITTTAIMTALITIFSMIFWSFIIGQLLDVSAVSEILKAVSWVDYGLIVLLLVPISAIFAATLLAISIYASSYKEAQNYMGPLSIFVIFPVIVAMTPGIALTFGWSLVPVANVALAIKELLKGTIDYNFLVPIFASTGGFALVSILFCVYWFNKESVLFR